MQNKLYKRSSTTQQTRERRERERERERESPALSPAFRRTARF